MKAYCSIGMSGESWSMCPIRRNSLLVHVAFAYPQILGTNDLVAAVVVVVVEIKIYWIIFDNILWPIELCSYPLPSYFFCCQLTHSSFSISHVFFIFIIYLFICHKTSIIANIQAVALSRVNNCMSLHMNYNSIFLV